MEKRGVIDPEWTPDEERTKQADSSNWSKRIEQDLKKKASDEFAKRLEAEKKDKQ